MGIATTQAIWRSGGDDSTRTAYCGSMVMAATFYTANIAVSSNATVGLGQTATVILPGNAVVTSVMITDPSTAGSINVGYILIDGSASSANAFVDGLTATSAKTVTPGSTNAGTNMGLIMNSTKESVITIESASGATGNVGGTIQYYVADYLFGQQNV
jgi:hypothetical protein